MRVPEPLRVLIVDDDFMVVSIHTRFVERMAGFEVVGSATSGAEALRLTSESRSTQAAARQLNITPKLLYKWQKAAQPTLESGSGESESAAMRELRAENRRLQQERDILKKALAIFMPPTS